MSTLNVDKVDPSTGTALEIGSSGDTITIPSGATIVNSGTATGFGAALTGSTNNTVTTVTGANAITGETNLIYDGTRLGVGASGASADLGVGVHVRTADSGAGVTADADELVLENSGQCGLTICSGTSADGRIAFADSGGSDRGIVNYYHGSDYMNFYTAGSERMRIDSNGKVGIGETSPLGNLHVKSADTGGSVSVDADELVVETTNGGMTILSGNANNGFVKFGDNGNNSIGYIKYRHDNNSMRFQVNASERFEINTEGDLMVAANQWFLLADNSAATCTAQWNRGSGQGGNTSTALEFKHGSSVVGTVGYTDGSTSYNTSSDYRLKENETSITDGIDRIKQLKPYRFNFKVAPDKTVDGFMAHEVSDIVPEAITGEKDAMIPEVLYTDEILYTEEVLYTDKDTLPEGKEFGDVKYAIGDVKTKADVLPEGKNFGDVKEETKIDPQGIDQAKLVPLLTSALQEAITKIETLETANTDLATRITALENA